MLIARLNKSVSRMDVAAKPNQPEENQEKILPMSMEISNKNQDQLKKSLDYHSLPKLKQLLSSLLVASPKVWPIVCSLLYLSMS